ncbi:UPF0489 family protein [Candidatus Gracilibacteria bacterium]|nr:UPF0489 family protein [Candidatus Gracilibacteria bacterium]
MHYANKQILNQNLGNNAFAWDERTAEYGQSPILTIPALIDGTLDDVKIGSQIVFEEIENGILRSCVGLENFVQLSENMIVFDNHNHAIYFWIDAVREGIIQPGFELIHIDEHSDLWNNDNHLDLEKAITNPEYAWDFTNLSCNVGNYILPAIESGLVGNMIRIENEYQIDAYIDYIPSSMSVLNIDLDIFAPELDHIPNEKKIKIIKNLLEKVQYVTIATSPYFIEQCRAINYLKNILEKIG